jgi:predicted RNA-binding protein Jag
MTETYEISDSERRIIHEALRAHADVMWDMGAEEELEETEELIDKFEP